MIPALTDAAAEDALGEAGPAPLYNLFENTGIEQVEPDGTPTAWTCSYYPDPQNPRLLAVSGG